jgi:hypothetical protein
VSTGTGSVDRPPFFARRSPAAHGGAVQRPAVGRAFTDDGQKVAHQVDGVPAARFLDFMVTDETLGVGEQHVERRCGSAAEPHLDRLDFGAELSEQAVGLGLVLQWPHGCPPFLPAERPST